MRALSLATGGMFVLTGAFKLLLLGPRGFAQALSSLGVPFPLVFGAFVPLLEIVGGLTLLLSRDKRAICAASALLCLDMLAAIALVGVPGALGRSWNLGNVQIGREAWRLPLEVGLLGACAMLLVRSLKGKHD